MGLKFRKRIKIAPGINLNLSKSGVSASLGKPGATVNVGKKGVKATVGVPGTGVSYSKKISGNSSRKVNVRKTKKSSNLLLYVLAFFIIIGYFLGSETDIQGISQSTVIASSLRVRSSPSIDSEVINQLKKGDVGSVTKVNGDWSLIEKGNFKGWVSNQYLSKN